jgi:hypothetical protein
MLKFLLSCFIACASFSSFSQIEPSAPSKKNRFGFNLGTNYSMMRTTNTNDLFGPYEGFGFTMGLLMDHKINKSLFFSPKIEMSFNQAGMEIKGESFAAETYKIFPVLLEFMPHLMYQPGSGKFSPYLTIGPNFRLPAQQKSDNSTQFGNGYDIAIDVGVGFLNELKHLGIAPELRFSYGTMNVNNNPLFQHIRYNKLTLVVNFK